MARKITEWSNDEFDRYNDAFVEIVDPNNDFNDYEHFEQRLVEGRAFLDNTGVTAEEYKEALAQRFTGHKLQLIVTTLGLNHHVMTGPKNLPQLSIDSIENAMRRVLSGNDAPLFSAIRTQEINRRPATLVSSDAMAFLVKQFTVKSVERISEAYPRESDRGVVVEFANGQRVMFGIIIEDPS